MKQSNGKSILEKQDIAVLSINTNILQLLNKHKINTLNKLQQKSRRDLLKLGLTPAETKKVEIEMQLQGLDLK